MFTVTIQHAKFEVSNAETALSTYLTARNFLTEVECKRIFNDIMLNLPKTEADYFVKIQTAFNNSQLKENVVAYHVNEESALAGASYYTRDGGEDLPYNQTGEIDLLRKMVVVADSHKVSGYGVNADYYAHGMLDIIRDGVRLK